MNEMMEYANTKGIELTASNGSNFNSVDDELLENFVKYRFRCITVSIDGASDETYRIYRQGGNFDTVIRNVRKLNEFKKQYSSPFPELTWQFVVFGHNENDIPKAEQMAHDLGMRFSLKLNGVSTYSPVKNTDNVRRRLGAVSQRDYWVRRKKVYLSACSSMWLSPQIASNGKLMGCCENKWGDFGNVFDVGLEACVKNEAFVYAKKMVTGKVPPQKGIPCAMCSSYSHKIKEGPLCRAPGLMYLAKTIWKR
jgi:MoaA/NifB/PqqE/SkfB family radical SAM enzyme